MTAPVATGQVYRDEANHRSITIERWSDHFKDDNGVCSCHGSECKPNQASKMLDKLFGPRCVCANPRCNFKSGACACDGIGCPYASMVICQVKFDDREKIELVAMPTARFKDPRRGYVLVQ